MVADPRVQRQRLEIRVFGMVQGVGFRAFARHHASALGLAGHARNLPDGSVEVIAEGPRIALEELLRNVELGPRLAAIERCEVSWQPHTGDTSWFSVER